MAEKIQKKKRSASSRKLRQKKEISIEERIFSPFPVDLRESASSVSFQPDSPPPAEENPVCRGQGIMKFFRTLSLFFTVAGICVFAFAAYLFFFSGKFSGDVKLTIEAPKDVLRGVPFDFEVGLGNNAETDLRDVTITLFAPRDILILDARTERGILKDPLGSISSGGVEKKIYRLLAVSGGDVSEADEDDVVKKIAARVSYSLGGAAGFEVQASKDVRAGESALRAELRKEEGQILSGSTFRISLVYSNVSNEHIEDLRMSITYPETFRYVSSDLPPDSLDNYWKLGALRAGSEGKISIQGILEGADNAEFAFPVTFHTSFEGKDYAIGQEQLGLSLAPSPINLKVSTNGGGAHVARAGETIRYEIRYANVSGIPLQDFVIRGTFLGEMFDLASVKSSANVDSRGRFVWDKSRVPELREVGVGAEGKVDLEVKVRDQFPISRSGDKNFLLRASVEASSPTTPYYLKSDKTRAFTEVVTKVAGRMMLDAKALYYDAASGITNAGSIPPRVGNPTEYTIHWILRNESTDIRDVRIRAALPPGVEWTGKAVSASGDVLPLYDELTREVSWEISSIPATKGILNAPTEAIFQVRATPDFSYAGKVMTLLGETRVTALDDFTGITLSAGDVPLTTQLVDDPSAGSSSGIVVE